MKNSKIKSIPNSPIIRVDTNIEDLDLKIRNIPKSRFYTLRTKKVLIPQFLSPKLAYFIGYFQGDGHLGKDKKRVEFADEYISQLKTINELSNEIFDTTGIIYYSNTKISLKEAYRLQINRNILNSYLYKIWNLPRGKKINLKIPPLMFKDKDILRWYLKGLFDADGTLPKDPHKCKQLFIDIAAKDLSLIEDIRIALYKFNIITLKPYCKKSQSPNSKNICYTWELKIRKKSEMIRFLKEIGFFHQIKSIRAQKLANILDP